MHGDVLIKDIVNDSITLCSRIGLQINSFERLLHDGITEGDISNTIDFSIRRDSADGQAHSQSNSDILNEHIFSAVGISISVAMGRLGDDHIVIVLAGDIVDMKVSAIRIDTISIEGKERNSAY